MIDLFSYKIIAIKSVFFILLTLGIFISCGNEEECELDTDSNTELIGDWKLIEIRPGRVDGNGPFFSVESDKIITFEEDGIITLNGDLCDMITNSDNPTSGTYAISESTLTLSECSFPKVSFFFEQDGNLLLISYNCFEGCQAKYMKCIC